jgi:hypothetical protein
MAIIAAGQQVMRSLIFLLQFNVITQNPPGVMENEGILHCFFESWRVCEGEQCRDLPPPPDRSFLIDFRTLILHNCTLVKDGGEEFTSCKPFRTKINPADGRIDFAVPYKTGGETKFSIFGEYDSNERSFEMRDADGHTTTVKSASGSCLKTTTVLVVPPPAK